MIIDIGGKHLNEHGKILAVGPNIVHDNVCNKLLYKTCEPVKLEDGLIVPDKEGERAINIKTLSFKYVEENVTQIYCDIKGNEQFILEDLLYYAHVQQSNLSVKLYMYLWKDKLLLNKLKELLAMFSVNIVDRYLFATPKSKEVVYKPNPTVAIISFNNYTHTKQMVEQLEQYTSDIVIVDNNSNYPPLLKYYEEEYKYTLFRMDKNYKHTCIRDNERIRQILGELIFITDPDIKFNENLPKDFMRTIFNVYSIDPLITRVGFALNITDDDIDKESKLKGHGPTIVEWESKFWNTKIFLKGVKDLILYKADLDTTFCLYDFKRSHGIHIRIAGDFTAKHLPWHKGWKNDLLKDEYEWYKNKSQVSHWV